MSNCEDHIIQRLQAIMTALLQRELECSLESVDGAIKQWRRGELDVFETHAELLKYAARAERSADRMAKRWLDSAGSLLRDAYDVGVVDHEEFTKLVGLAPEEVEPSQQGDALSAEGIGVEVGALAERSLPGKRELAEDLLAAGPILVHVDARNPEVEVPEHFRKDPKLILRFGYGLTPAIIDLAVDERYISGTLIFSGVPSRCMLPWLAVYAVVSEVDQKGMVWPEDVPAAIASELTEKRPMERVREGKEAAPEGVVNSSHRAKGRASHLKLVK